MIPSKRWSKEQRQMFSRRMERTPKEMSLNSRKKGCSCRCFSCRMKDAHLSGTVPLAENVQSAGRGIRG